MRFRAFRYIYWLCSGTGPVGCRETREAETGALARKSRQENYHGNLAYFFTPFLVENTWHPFVEPSGTIRRATRGAAYYKSENPIFSHSLHSFLFLSRAHSWLQHHLPFFSIVEQGKASRTHSFVDRNSIGSYRWNRNLKLYERIPTNQGKGGFLLHGFWWFGAVWIC